LHLVAGVAPGVVLSGAGQVLGQAGQGRLAVVAGDGAGAGAVTKSIQPDPIDFALILVRSLDRCASWRRHILSRYFVISGGG
jgi:hypothetical protein